MRGIVTYDEQVEKLQENIRKVKKKPDSFASQSLDIIVENQENESNELSQSSLHSNNNSISGE